MASMAGLTVYNFPPQPPKWDAVGKFYICFAVMWSCLVFGGMGILVANRHNSIVRVRGLILPLTSITFLHAYWILAQVVYPIGMTMSLPLAYSVQFFFMGIWFPLGIAVFHVFNLRFLHVAEMQKRFTQPCYRRHSASSSPRGTMRTKFFKISSITDHDFETRTLVVIAVCMVIQVLLTVGMWLACSKYHPTFGVPGTGIKGDTLPEQLADLGRGWEWWPSVLWQVVWTWMVAPILLCRAWEIRDTIGWRVQTIGCCVANLHATPMFLIASYVPAFAPINAYYAPSQWIHLSIMMFAVFTIFVPCFLLLKQRLGRMRSKAVVRKVFPEPSQETSQSSPRSRDGILVSESSSSDGLDSMSMHSLENTLLDDPTDLQEFSARRDFSGENIAFLRAILAWEASWPVHEPSTTELQALFLTALNIYTDLVSIKDADFPINISAPEGRFLTSIFENAARAVHGDVNTNAASPFAMVTKAPVSSASSELEKSQSMVIKPSDIPGEFTVTVFSRAFEEIKYLVFTNTWPKFMREKQRSRTLCESSESRVSSRGQEII